MTFTHTYLSLGAGVQSSAMYCMAVNGDHGVPRPEVAIFADTQDEPAYVYEQIERLRNFGGDVVPIVTVTAGQLSAAAAANMVGTKSRFAAIPMYFKHAGGATGIGRRQCTNEYKIQPIERYVRRTMLGLKKGQRVPKGTTVHALIGISLDEVTRMRNSRHAWCKNTYPLIDARLRRRDCLRYIESLGMPQPLRSACVFCPFHGDDYWRWMKKTQPEEWERACKVDEALRDQSGVTNPSFVHRSCKPLREASLGEDQREFMFENECEGMCGV